MKKSVKDAMKSLKKMKGRLSKIGKAEEKTKYKEWLEFLEKDEDWDYGHIFRVLIYKLKRTRARIKKNNIIADADKIAAEIQAVIDLLERVYNDEYDNTDDHKAFKEKYGTINMEFGKPDKDGVGAIKIAYTKETPENREELRKEVLRLANLEDELRKADLRKAFELMAEQIWGWWD